MTTVDEPMLCGRTAWTGAVTTGLNVSLRTWTSTEALDVKTPSLIVYVKVSLPMKPLVGL